MTKWEHAVEYEVDPASIDNLWAYFGPPDPVAVIATYTDGRKFKGDLESYNEDGTFTVTNWKEVFEDEPTAE